jgi:hypothetical protein
MAEAMDAIFGADAQVTDTVATTPATGSTSEKTERIRAMREGFRSALAADPSLADRCGKLSPVVEVINTLGYGKSGNIKVDKKQSTKDNRVLEPTSKIVGYAVKNNGSEPIPYTTEEFAKDETDKFVGTQVQKSWAPGETIVLSRKYMAMLCSIPEIGMVLSNGKIVMPASKNKSSITQTLASCYFIFNNELNLSTNDDAVKLQIDTDGVVKPEYEVAFGDLNNPKESKRHEKGAGGPKYGVQDYAANYIQQLLKEGGMN